MFSRGTEKRIYADNKKKENEILALVVRMHFEGKHGHGVMQRNPEIDLCLTLESVAPDLLSALK